MKYTNPIVKGFYPDPSICMADGKYYLVCSTMQFYPGVALLESDDLVNFHQIGSCLIRPEQVDLDKVHSSTGVFAPTIRYNNGRFYVVTTNNSTGENFYVYTDDIYSKWSDPVYVEQDGIDPSILFDGGHTYFLSTGEDDYGDRGIIQSEIDIETGRKLCKSKVIWKGSGGRYIEGPHMYNIEGKYYLVIAEGGTEYGHMVTYAVADSPFGPFEGYKDNPVLTNRNLGGYTIQGVGHGDLFKDYNGNWWIIHLGFRQQDKWMPYHQLGREVFLTPVHFREDGTFTAGDNGTVTEEFTVDNGIDVVQRPLDSYSFKKGNFIKEALYIRRPYMDNYEFQQEEVILQGTKIDLDQMDSPTFVGIRQRDFVAKIECKVTSECEEAGLSLYLDEEHHYEVAMVNRGGRCYIDAILTIGDAKCIKKEYYIEGNSATLIIYCDKLNYTLAYKDKKEEVILATVKSMNLTSEVAGGFTGVVAGIYAVDDNGKKAVFRDFFCEYE